MGRALIGLAIALVAALGCGGDSAGLILVYPDSDTANRANTLSVYVFRPAATNLCTQLSQATNPLSPESTNLVREAASIKQPADSDLDVLSNLSAGEHVFYAEAHDASGTRFLAGCVRARLKNGSGLRIELEDLNPMMMVDAGVPDADTTDAPPADAAPPPLLSITVDNMRIPGAGVSGAQIIVGDGTDTLTTTTNGSGNATINVSALTPPLTVTAAAAVADFRSASTVVGVTPAFDGANATSTMRMALDLGDLDPNGTVNVMGSISGLVGGDVATVRYRSTFIDSFADVDGSGGTYALSGLPSNKTYSVLLLRENGGSPTFAAVKPTFGVGTTPITSNFSETASAIDLSASFSVSAPIAALNDTPVFRSMMAFARGPLIIESADDPATTFNRNVPRLNNTLAGWEYQFESEGSSVDGSLFALARVVTTSVGALITLALPVDLPTISGPASGAAVAVATAQTLSLGFGNLFTNHDLVHVQLTGTVAALDLRWHLVAPAGTTGITLPVLGALGAGERVMQANGAYDIIVTPMTVNGAFDYDADVVSDFTGLILATDIPLLARRTQAFTVVP